jgi:hypothetical protein
MVCLFVPAKENADSINWLKFEMEGRSDRSGKSSLLQDQTLSNSLDVCDSRHLFYVEYCRYTEDSDGAVLSPKSKRIFVPILHSRSS